MKNFFNLFSTPRITIIKVPKEGLVDAMINGNFWLWFESHLGYMWLLIALAFLFVELSTPGLFFFISFAIGALFAGIMAFLGYSFLTQCLGALGVMLFSFWVLKSYLKMWRLSDVAYAKVDTNIDALVGQTGIITTDISLQKTGRAKIRTEEWVARVADDVELEKGTVVKVVRVEGNSVVVEKTSKPQEENHA